MSRSVRGHEPPQPSLPLGHSLVHWDTLPAAVRERVLAERRALGVSLAQVGRDLDVRPDSQHVQPVAPNVLRRQFRVDQVPGLDRV